MNRWDYTVRGVKDPINDDTLTFEETRDRVVSAIKASRWHALNDEVQDLVEDLETAYDVVLFDEILEAIYDVADYDRAWIT